MNIAVVGGGAAGWITALYAQKVFPDYKITLIESSSIGILGAGEGATPHLISLLDFLNISTEDIIKSCGSTIKNGIEFLNWSEKNIKYFHAFDPSNIAPWLSEDYIKLDDLDNPQMFFSYVENFIENENINKFNFCSKISDLNKIPFIFNSDRSNTKILNFDQISYWSIHFDASKFASYLKNVGQARGVNVIDSNIKNISIKENGFIEKIILENNREVAADFFFDCSGFHRIIIGKTMKSEWNSYKKNLPMKSAILFPIKNQGGFPYTKSIAMEYGWMWQIPLQHRIGCGYVFDSDFITEDLAKNEILNKFNYNLDESRLVKFDPGTYVSPWMNNAVAIGLSSSFFEPLEASSIWMFIRNLNRFFSDKSNLILNSKSQRDAFNRASVIDSEQVRDFIYLHYITDKTNNNFWRDFIKNNECPDFIKEILDICKTRPPKITELGSERMYWSSYYQIIFGNNILDKENMKIFYKSNSLDKKIYEPYHSLKKNQDDIIDQCIDMDLFIRYIAE